MISNEEIKKIAHLSRIHIEEKDMEAFANKLQSVMEMIDQLPEVDSEGAEPLTSAHDMDITMRQDEINDGNIAEDLMSNSPGETAELSKEVKCYVVPKVIG